MIRRIVSHVAFVALALAALCCSTANVHAADPLRAPAYPLIANDPYFSVWSFTDALTDSFPVHWTGKINALVSLARASL